MRRLLHVFFAFAVLIGIGAEPSEPKAQQADICCPCCQGRACDCGMPTPRTPRCPTGQNAPAAAQPVARVSSPAAAQAENASRRETLPWQSLANYAQAPESRETGTLNELPRPPDRILQRLACLSTFRI